MQSFLSFILLFLLLISQGYSSTSLLQDTLSKLLLKHNIEAGESLYLVSIDPAACTKCRVGISGFKKRMDDAGLTNQVVYVIRGLRPKEVDYYISKELSFLLPASRIVADDSLYKYIDKKAESVIAHYQGGNLKHIYPVNDYRQVQLPFFTKKEMQLQLVDSVLIDESLHPFSRSAKVRILSDDRFAVLDPRYSSVSIINSKSGKTIRSLPIRYDYSELFRKYISSSPDAVAFAEKQRARLKELNLPEIELGEICTYRSAITVSAKFRFYQRRIINGDTTLSIYNFPFVILSDTTLKSQDYIAVPLFDSYFPRVNNAFQQTGDSTFIFTLLDEKDDRNIRKNYLASYVYNKHDKTFSPASVLKTTLHDYFTVNNIGHSYGPNSITMLNNQPVFYFNWLIPEIYNTDSTIMSYPDTSYRTFTQAMWQSAPMQFEIIHIAQLTKNSAVFITSELPALYFSIMDLGTGTITAKAALPEYYCRRSKYMVYGNMLYIFKSHSDKTMLYRFTF